MTTPSQTLDAGAAIPSDAPEFMRKKPRTLRQRLRLPLMIVVPVIVAGACVYYYATGGRYVSTDDAQIASARVSVSADIPGRVTEVDVGDNQVVKAGQVLFKLDDAAPRIAVENAKAKLAGAKLQIDAAKATYGQKQTDVKTAQDTLAFEQSELARQRRLLASGIASQAQYDQAAHAVDNARQQVAANQQAITTTLASLGGNADTPDEQEPEVQMAQAALDSAQLELTKTVVKAPIDGTVTKVEQLQPGDYVTATTPVFSLVATGDSWIEADFKETDLTHMQPGQLATVDIDTYPDQVFQAHVESLSPGTGSTFSLMPPENASGNWVKVVQRLPVRLVIDNPPANAPLHAGLSANVEVDTGYHRPLLSFIDHALAGTPDGGTPKSVQPMP